MSETVLTANFSGDLKDVREFWFIFDLVHLSSSRSEIVRKLAKEIERKNPFDQNGYYQHLSQIVQ